MRTSHPGRTGLQSLRAERARHVATAAPEQVAAESGPVSLADLTQVYGYAFGVTQATITELLEIIDSLTGGARLCGSP